MQARSTLALVVVAAAAALPSAADVLVVSPGGTYTQIQQAVDAAADGDAILVQPGTYAGFTVDGKSLQIVGVPRQLGNGATERPRVDGTVLLRNLPPRGTLVLSRLLVVALDDDVAPGEDALRVEGCFGPVRLEDCSFTGGWGGYTATQGGTGGRGAAVTGSIRVAFVGSSVHGGHGGGDVIATQIGGPGGTGLLVSSSAVALYDCTVIGGTGGFADDSNPAGMGGRGGAGCLVQSLGMFASGTRFVGGIGGPHGGSNAMGGTGLVVQSPAYVLILDCTFQGGSGTPPGASLSGTVDLVPGAARQLAPSTRLLSEGQLLGLTYRGEPGDAVWLARSSRAGFRFLFPFAGVWLVPWPTLLLPQPAGVAGADGVLVLTAQAEQLPPGVDAKPMVLQAFVLASDGAARLSGGVHALVVNCSELLPDCDGNGAWDLCDLVAQTSFDVNGNGVPDVCEAFPTWHVDAAAAPGGDGSAAAPFQALADAFAAAGSGDTILVADGVYAGSANRDLNFGTRELVVRSQNGAAACTIDCELSGRAFLIAGGQTGASRLEGFTVVRGSASAGGAIRASGASPRILGCTFRDCSAVNGGAVQLGMGAAQLRSCRFEANVAQREGGGLRVSGAHAPGFVADCTFVGNSAGSGGGSHHWGDRARIWRCAYLGNTARSEGGGMYVFVPGTGMEGFQLDHLLVAGNTAPRGGGIRLFGFGQQDGGWIRGSTFVSNLASLEGGALHTNGGEVELENCVLWGDAAPVGPEILPMFGNLIVRHSDVQGGLAAIPNPGHVTWGPGNLDLDPLFADPDGPDDDPLTLLDNDWRLGPFSPCIDAGDNAAVALDVLDLDGDGNAFERVPFDLDGLPRFVDDPLVPDTGAGTAPIVDMGPYERP